MLTLGEASHEIIMFTTPRPPFCKETHVATLRGWGQKDRHARLAPSCPGRPRAGPSHARKDAILDVRAAGASGVSRLRDYLTMTASLQFSSGTIWPWPHHFSSVQGLSDHDRITSVQLSSVAQSCPSLCDPMNHSTPGLPVHHHLPEFTQTHVHPVAWAAPNGNCPARPTQPTEPWEIIYVKVTTFWGGCCYCCFSKLLKWDIKSTCNRLHKPWVYSTVKFHKWVPLYTYDPDQDIGHFHNPEAPLMLLYK